MRLVRREATGLSTNWCARRNEMRVLITGSHGFIGQHLTRELRDNDHEVEGWDIHDGKQYDIANVLDFRAGVRRCRPDLIVHLAAQVGRVFGEDDVMHTVKSNSGLTAI